MPIKVIYSGLTHEITILLLTNLYDLAAYQIKNHEGRIIRRGKIIPHLQQQYISTSGLPGGDYTFCVLNEELCFHKTSGL
jgi:hypothetical protein